MIFVGFLMLIAMLGLLFFSGAIYDAEEKHSIETFFFEPNSQSARRITAPVSADNMPDDFLREIIISRFLNEYFYVIPDVKNAQARTEFKNTDGTKSILRTNARRVVSEKWAQTQAPEIAELASKKALRNVRVTDISESESGHLVVKYELKTWNQPNNVLALPEVSEGYIYLNISKNPIQVQQTEEALHRLEQGYDPVAAFSFEVLGVEQN